MESERLSNLIGLIYDSAVDLELWPLLLQGLTHEVDGCASDELRTQTLPASAEHIGDYISQWYESQESGIDIVDDKIHYFSREEGELFGLILPHLRRAIKINHDLVSLTTVNQSYASVLERLPIGMVVVDQNARVYAKNPRFDSLLEMKQSLRIQAGRLQAANHEDTASLNALIHDVCGGTEQETPGLAMRLSGSSPVSLLILPLIQDDIFPLNSRVIIFVASLANDIRIEAQTLKNMYGLSQAESRLTLSLIRGASLDETAEQFHVSTHTLRTQLKSIYAKTDCRRQAELMVKILTSPAILSTQQAAPVKTLASMHEQILPVQERLAQSVFLQDGRRLSFAEYGPADGMPVILMHTATGSRLQVPEDDSALYQYGVRLLAPDRPGIGMSDSKNKHTIMGWADDVEEFADCLGIEHFGVIGNSVGGCFALATAYALPQRVQSVTLLSPIAEFHEMDNLDGIIPIFRMFLGLGRYVPSITLPFMRLAVRGVLRDPQKYYDNIVAQMPDVDAEIFNRPGFREIYLPTALEALRNSEQGVAVEQLLIARKWGVPLSEIQQPVAIWHGAHDRHNPLYMAESLQAVLPNAHLKVIPEGGHFLIYSHWSEIIQSLMHSFDSPN